MIWKTRYIAPKCQMCLNEIEVFKNACLKNFCTFSIGGKAKYVFVVHSNKTLIVAVNYCKQHKIRYKIVGLGANLLFDDAGFDGAIIVNRANKILFRKNCVYADGGVAFSALISACAERCLGGIEKLAGVPATVGGAVVNGLGAFGVEFNSFVEYVVCLNQKDKLIKLKNSACGFGYRTSKFKQNKFVILRVKLKLNFANQKTIKANMLSAIKKKSATQPLNYPSAGSVFKRFFKENNDSYKDEINNKNYYCKNDENNNKKDKNSSNDYDNSYKNKIISKNFYYNYCKNGEKGEIKQPYDYNKSYNEIIKDFSKNQPYDYNNSYKDNANVSTNNNNTKILNSLNNKSGNEQGKTKQGNNPAKNCQQIVPAKIIDELGLKGLKVGGAMVSTKHAGFIVNSGNATSKDVLNLIELINQKVQAAYGFTLPLEIEIVK